MSFAGAYFAYMTPGDTDQAFNRKTVVPGLTGDGVCAHASGTSASVMCDPGAGILTDSLGGLGGSVTALVQRPICLITHEFYPKHGGIATFAEEIARASAALGYKIEVWAQRFATAKERRWPFPVRRLSVRGTHNLACSIKLAMELIRERRYLRNAIVYMPEPGPLLAMMPLQFFSSFRPKRLIVTFHGSEILKFYKNPAYRALTRRLIKKTWRISTLTEFTRQLLCECFPEARGKTILTPGALRSDLRAEEIIAATENGAVVTSAVGQTRPAASKNTKRSPGNSQANARALTTPPFIPLPIPEAVPKKHVVLTVGRLHPRKGQIYTLRALQALPLDLRANVEYWIAGKAAGSEYEKQLHAAARKAQAVGLHVRFLGEVVDRDLGEVYERADVFAMTSINYRQSVEGFGLVYLEASAHGLPVVAHDVGGVSEAVINGETGLVVPAPEEEADDLTPLTSAFEQLLRDDALRVRMGNAGREHALRNSWIDSAKKLFANDVKLIPGAHGARTTSAVVPVASGSIPNTT